MAEDTYDREQLYRLLEEARTSLLSSPPVGPPVKAPAKGRGSSRSSPQPDLKQIEDRLSRIEAQIEDLSRDLSDLSTQLSTLSNLEPYVRDVLDRVAAMHKLLARVYDNLPKGLDPKDVKALLEKMDTLSDRLSNSVLTLPPDDEDSSPVPKVRKRGGTLLL